MIRSDDKSGLRSIFSSASSIRDSITGTTTIAVFTTRQPARFSFSADVALTLLSRSAYSVWVDALWNRHSTGDGRQTLVYRGNLGAI